MYFCIILTRAGAEAGAEAEATAAREAEGDGGFAAGERLPRGALDDGGVLIKRVLNFSRIDIFTTTNHHILHAIDDKYQMRRGVIARAKAFD